jgi:sugar lactone lactonase YvrE
VDGKTGEVKVVADDFVQPNGIAFSPDEKKVYIIDTGISEGQNPPNIRVFDVDIDAGRLSNGKVFAPSHCAPDIAVDVAAHAVGYAGGPHALDGTCAR